MLAFAILGAGLLASDIPPAEAQGPRIAGTVPFAGGLSLVVWGGGTTSDLVGEVQASGCLEPTIWTEVPSGGSFVVFVVGAPAQVNARWNSLFSPGPPSGKVLVLRCARDLYLWPFASDSPWNTPLGSSAAYASPDNEMTRDLLSMGIGINSATWSHPVFRATNSDPERRAEVDGATFAVIHVPDDAEPALPSLRQTNTADAHLHIVTPDGKYVYEFYAASRLSDGTVRARRAERIPLDGNGLAERRGQSIGVRAYGGSAIAGLIRRWELEQGYIPHVLAIALDSRLLKVGPVWPATTEDRTASSVYKGSIPMGSLIAIPPDVNLQTLGLSPSGFALARALQDYGAYVTDAAAGGVKFYAETAASDLLDDLQADLDKIFQYLRPVLNNSEEAPGGGGRPRAPMAPPMAR